MAVTTLTLIGTTLLIRLHPDRQGVHFSSLRLLLYTVEEHTERVCAALPGSLRARAFPLELPSPLLGRRLCVQREGSLFRPHLSFGSSLNDTSKLNIRLTTNNSTRGFFEAAVQAFARPGVETALSYDDHTKIENNLLKALDIEFDAHDWTSVENAIP
ncbi:hypothetical protein MTO96_023610 [Rhipicephalus appendiculatus]